MRVSVHKVEGGTHATILLLSDSRTKRQTVLPHEHCWCVTWQSDAMPAPSFWYYGTRKEARDVARALRRGDP